MTRSCPDLWIEKVTGETLAPYQVEIARAVATNRKVAVASANSVGKSFLSARIAAWFLKTYSKTGPTVVLTTAPTNRQVYRILWKEISIVQHKAKRNGYDLGGKALQKSWEFGADTFAMGFSPRDYDPDAFQGFHADNILVIVDEAAGVSEQIYEAIFSVAKGGNAKILLVGNPTTMNGTFYDAFRMPGWWTTHVSAFDVPNVQQNKLITPGTVTYGDVEDARTQWGESSQLWRTRILGQFPESTEDSMIALSWIEAAGQQKVKNIPAMLSVIKNYDVEIGADIARYGADSSIFCARKGPFAFAMKEYSKQDLMETVGQLARFADETKAVKVKVDAGGLGAGVVDRLREVRPNLQVIEMNFGGSPIDKRSYANSASEWYGTLGKMLQAGEAFGPLFTDKRVVRDLSSRRYKIGSDGRLGIEKKEDFRKRGLPSPDWGDAISMAFAATNGANGHIDFW